MFPSGDDAREPQANKVSTSQRRNTVGISKVVDGIRCSVDGKRVEVMQDKEDVAVPTLRPIPKPARGGLVPAPYDVASFSVATSRPKRDGYDARLLRQAARFLDPYPCSCFLPPRRTFASPLSFTR